jgi:hypothetical protein
MITATYINETGEETEVEILKTDKASGTAVVTPQGWRGSGFWWDNKPEWFVEIFRLSEIRITCKHCGEDFDPAGTCPACGWNWKNSDISDEQDAAETQAELNAYYRG